MTESEYLGQLQSNTAAANAFNAQQAQKQMDFQVAQNAKAMEFNHREAELNRNWQKMMSDTSHQREIQDLIAAGLNPVLSALGGSGASVGSGSAASVSGNVGSKADADTSINAALAGLLGTMISGQTQRDVANINAAASMHNAEVGADATRYAANSSYAGLMQQLAHMEQYPTTMFGLLSSVLQNQGDWLNTLFGSDSAIGKVAAWLTGNPSGSSSGKSSSGYTVAGSENNLKDGLKNVVNLIKYNFKYGSNPPYDARTDTYGAYPNRTAR